MAQRRNSYRADSAEVQGEGSFVTLRSFRWGEVKDKVAVKQDVDGQTVETVTANIEFLASAILEWNWVDDDGNPLPLPKDNPGVMDLLTLEEITFLSQQSVGKFRR